MHPKRNPDYYRLGTTDRLLSLSGVPITYLKTNIDPNRFRFLQTSFKSGNDVIIINPDSQHRFWHAMVQNVGELGRAGVYSIGSAPTDKAAYEFATWLTKIFFDYRMKMKKFPEVKWVDLGRPDWDYLKDSEIQPEIVVIHGINENSESRRIEIAKDFARRSQNSTTFLIVSTANILEFMMGRLNIAPDGVWQLGPVVHRRVV